MPIVFRCSHCGQKLSITSKKAGREVTCPECAHRITVPVPEELKAVVAEGPAVGQLQPAGMDRAEDDQDGVAHSTKPLPSAQEIQEEWQHKHNPWIETEDEDDDFSLGGLGLEESGLDMTPMVDVTFLLLIFFMITASFSMQKSMRTAPPEPDQEGAAQSLTMEDLEEESVVVEIDEENNIRVDDVPVSGTGELVDVLAAKIGNEGKTEMLIEAHPNSRHGLVVAVTDAGIEVQMQRIRRTMKKGMD